MVPSVGTRRRRTTSTIIVREPAGPCLSGRCKASGALTSAGKPRVCCMDRRHLVSATDGNSWEESVLPRSRTTAETLQPSAEVTCSTTFARSALLTVSSWSPSARTATTRPLVVVHPTSRSPVVKAIHQVRLPCALARPVPTMPPRTSRGLAARGRSLIITVMKLRSEAR